MKTPFKLYFWGIFIILMIAFLIGFALPGMISAPSTELFLFGIFLSVLVPVFLAYLVFYHIVPLVKKIINEQKNKEN